MGGSNRLRPIVQRCRWVSDEAGLFRVVPELSGHGLPLESWNVGTQGEQWVSPLTGILSMAGPLVEILEQAKTTDVASFVNASNEVVESDGLVSRLVVALDDARPDQAHRLVMGLARLTALLVNVGRSPGGVEPAVGRRAGELATSVADMPAMQRAALMAQMASAVSARMAAALSRSHHGGNPLAARLIANQLVWVLPHDAFDPATDMAFVSRIAGVEIDPSVVHMVSLIAGVAAKESKLRRGGRKERPADGLLDHLEHTAMGDPLLDPRTGPSVVRLLPHLVEARALKGTVSDHKLAARYLEPNAVRTVSGAWSALLEQLSTWDALAAAMEPIQFVSAAGGLFRLDGLVLDASARWSLRVPRADARMPHAVVACRFSGLMGQGGAQPGLRRAIHKRWTELLPKGSVHCELADHGIVAFQRASDAMRFGLRINADFIGADGMLNSGGDSVAVNPGSRVAVGVSHGQVVGGTDGVTAWLNGPAVSEAIHLAGRGTPKVVMHDPLSIRRIGVGTWGLMSNGVCCSRAAAASAWNDWGGGVHRYGDGSDVSGLSRDFETYPVDGWAVYSEGAVLFVSLGSTRGAPIVELLPVDGHAMKDLQARDIQLTESDDILGVEEPVLEMTDDDPFAFADEKSVEAEVSSVRGQWTDIGFGDDDGSKR